jgi:hypothetical protein
MGAAFRQGRAAAWLAAILAVAFTTAADAQQRGRANTVNYRATIVSFAGDSLTVKTVEGETVTLSVPKKARISSLTRADFATLKKGDFIASAGMKQKDGTLKAIDVRIFPATGRHPPDYHRKFRLGPDSTMTNATVDAIVSGVKGSSFKAKYKGGEQTIVVAPETMVMRQDPAKRDALKPGAHVSIVAAKGKDGALGVVRMAVGVNGLMPPT